MVLQPAQGHIRIYGAAAGKNAFIELRHRVVLGIAIALFRLSGGQGQHDRGDLLADIGKILGTGGLGAASALSLIHI